MSDLPTIDQPENLDYDDVEAHGFRGNLVGQSAPAADDSPADDTECPIARVKAVPDEDDTEGHATRGKG